MADIFTKMTFGVLYNIPLIAIAGGMGNWTTLLISAPLAFISHLTGLITSKWGTFSLFGKHLTWDELIRYICVTGAGVIQLIF